MRKSFGIGATIFALLLAAGVAPAQIGDAKCVDKANNFARKVSDAQVKKARACVKSYGKGKLLGTVEACLAADPGGKLQAKQDKVTALFAVGAACDGQAGTDLVTDAATINAAHLAGPPDLMHAIFGPDLDAGVLAQTKPQNKCQDVVALRSGQLFSTWVKEFRKCKKAAMKAGATDTAAVVTACLSAAAERGIGSALADAKGKLAKTGAKLSASIGKSCVDAGADLDALAPGCAGGGVSGDAGDCMADLAECHACLAIKAADDLDVDCDLVDDGILGTCPGAAAFDAQCEILNGAECFLPFPSSRFLVADGSTATGLRVALPNAGMPGVIGAPWDAAPLNELDGFSPTAQVLMHFPQGVDLTLSDAARLIAPGSGSLTPPWIDTRTYSDRSLDADSPSVLLRADTGERILHFLELDARATGGNVPGRQALFLRPAESLVPGERYIVALRNLTAPGGAAVAPEAAFAALRDNVVTGIPAIEARRAPMESDVFTPLTGYGVTRDELVLAFDFTVQSDDQLTRQLLSMRDQAFAWLDTVEATPALVTFTVSGQTVISACATPDDVEWKRVFGTFESPLFLTGLPVQTGPQFLNVDGNDVPVQNGFMDAPFDVTIPCSVFDPMIVSRPMVLGHGIFGTGRSMVNSIPNQKALHAPWTYLGAGTDWIGLSSRRDGPSTDLLWIGTQIIGIGSSQLNNFTAFPDRLRQGMLNQLVLGSMMKRGLFNRDPAFETSPGVGVFPGAGEEMYYYGISLGGIHGTLFAALTPDVERHVLDVPAINFSCLLQRSTQFSTFDFAIQSIGVADPMQFALLIGLVHELWVGAEPAGFARHITTDPLPGSGGAKQLLYQAAWLDKQVSNQCTEAAARTLGLPSLEGSLTQGLVDIQDVVGPVPSAYVMYDSGSFDLFDPAHQPHIPPLANIIPTTTCDPHGRPRITPAAIRQMIDFLQPGGQVTNFCTGACDAIGPMETPGGGTCSGGPTPGAFCADDVECGGGTCVPVAICNPAP